tara:strand:- start:816 stop:983 length:168 start_codon:yes stop_codon:yes gene_type:complete
VGILFVDSEGEEGFEKMFWGVSAVAAVRGRTARRGSGSCILLGLAGSLLHKETKH